MTDYALHRMNTREFEHLVQALLLGRFGAAVQIFGDGSDNGREAFYTGTLEMAIDDPDQDWTGDTVFQAKFLQEPRGTTVDTGWFRQQVEAELSVWRNPDSSRRKKIGLPDNILFLTNVTLGPGAGGGIDTTQALSDAAAVDMGISNITTWHFDTIGRLLDGQSDVRRAFAGLITPGDVLEQLAEVLTGEPVDVGKTLVKHARRSLMQDQSIRLSESGDPAQARLRVNQIAIDLPANVSRKGGAGRTDAARLAIALGDRCLADGVWRKTRDQYNPGGKHLLLLGGPGQGKTTLSQLITAAYRAEFARTESELSRYPELVATLEHLSHEKIDLPKNRRWPLRVDLAKLADDAAGGLGIHLLKWVAQDLSAPLVDTITAGELYVWLKNWPCVLILDGLDEVVAPTAREAVNDAVKNLLEDVAENDIDLFVVVTSRPQGYAGELGGLSFETAELLELTVDQSLAYARRLIELRHHDEPAFAREVVARIEKAAETPLTARLMGTPLQTTIMTMINEASARAPQTRWELFNTYYDTVYRRESNKSGGLGFLLTQHREDVNSIHEQAAREIQYRTERTNHQDAVIGRSDLHRITLARLISEGQSQSEAASLASKIMQASTERLVLLVPQNADDIGFEIRSLREYLVARSIASGEKEDIIARMRAIRDAINWRNIFLLAAGKLLVDRPEMQQSLVDLLAEQGPDHAVNRLVPFGSQVAIDILADGLATTKSKPKYRDALLDQALKLLEYSSGFSDYASPLANVLGQISASDSNARRRIVYALQRSLAHDLEGSAAAWSVLRYVEQDRTNALGSSTNQLVAHMQTGKTELDKQALAIWFEAELPVAFGGKQLDVRQLGAVTNLLAPDIIGAMDRYVRKFFDAVFVTEVAHETDSVILLGDAANARVSLLTTDLSRTTITSLAHIALELEPQYWCVRVLIGDQIWRALSSPPVWRHVSETFDSGAEIADA
ncbi:hypothetical protein R3P93_23235 [Rhodococcus cerastii]|uniref:NACHT domain-containing protein n=1 Tax=Rhodococcus cerastii TaxID=908616 RepID=A0ABU4D6Y2_9NOCA|nr:hypothetical protein [Rhodococcus cerastii]MDV6305490.1 hypothetical protein [Rhodococcus cerastii]